MFLNRHAVAQHAFVPLAVAGGHQAELPQHGSGMARKHKDFGHSLSSAWVCSALNSARD